MCIEHKLRAIAGSFILISLALAHWVSPYWLWFTAFVGVNMLQSSFSKWCLMEIILRKFFKQPGCCSCSAPKPS